MYIHTARCALSKKKKKKKRREGKKRLACFRSAWQPFFLLKLKIVSSSAFSFPALSSSYSALYIHVIKCNPPPTDRQKTNARMQCNFEALLPFGYIVRRNVRRKNKKIRCLHVAHSHNVNSKQYYLHGMFLNSSWVQTYAACFRSKQSCGVDTTKLLSVKKKKK